MSEAVKQLNQNLRELQRRKREERLTYYKPYPKQREFHEAGKAHRERLLMAGNQNGKTYPAAAEVSMHATGIYPDDWNGRRWERPVRIWIGGIADDLVRDNPQKHVMGVPGLWGTGFVPKSCIVPKRIAMSHGVTGAIDTAYIRHKSGGYSVIIFKSYKEGREKWQSDTVDIIWYDEEPPMEIYSEGLARISATSGMVLVTLTPLKGGTVLVNRFYLEKSPDRHLTQMTIEDAEHIPVSERQKIIDGYPEHEREARARGVPLLGSGRVFPVDEKQIKVDPFDIPSHWPAIGGIDFGWDHPTAAVKIHWDRDADRVFVTAEYRQKEKTPVLHAGTLRTWGKWLPWAWPHDGLQHDKGSGDQLAEIYRSHGLDLLSQRATFEDGTNGLEAGVMMMLERMQTDRFKVFSHLGMWFEEFRMYHRKDGLIVKQMDDLMSATRYGVMMLRSATTYDARSNFFRPIVYDNRGIV